MFAKSISFALVIGILFLSCVSGCSPAGDSPVVPTAGQQPVTAAGQAVAPTTALGREEIRRQMTERVWKALQGANQEGEQQIGPALSQLETFFKQAKYGTPEFVDEALSLSSKWWLAIDYVPFTRGDRHETFLNEAFEEHVFQPTALSKVLECVIRDYLATLADVENRMLVRLRLDMQDLPAHALPALANDAQMKAEFNRAIADVQKRVAADLGKDVGQLAISEAATQLAMRIAGRLLEQVAVRLGVEAGILTAGGTTGWGTLGAGIVVGFIVDWIVSEVWDWYADPKGELVMVLNRDLDRLYKLIVAGDEENRGLRDELQTLAKQRAALREAAILKMFDMPKD